MRDLPKLTEEGRRYAMEHARTSITANVALQAEWDETTWPEEFLRTAVHCVNAMAAGEPVDAWIAKHDTEED